MNNRNTLQPKARQFIDNNYGLLLLITGLVFLILIIRLDTIINFVSSIFNAGYNSGLENNRIGKSNFYSIGRVLGSLLYYVTSSGIMGLLFGGVFYRFFFKFILRDVKYLNIVNFILWLVIFFILFRSGILWIFNKNNFFMNGTFTVEGYRKVSSTLLAALMFIFIIAYGLVKNYIQTTKTQAKLIAQKSQAELAALKAQINPHFLFNVLNNLYGTAIVEESPKTSEGILQLSSIMRHVVEGTKNEKIELEKEVRFLNDYIDLSKIRIPNRPNIRIETKIDYDEIPTMIAPLLVIPYLENAFKYGISMNEECFIEMSYIVKNQQLEFVCRNSIIKTNDKLEVGTGTGLENTQKRLDLYYHSGYQLNTSSVDGVFTVKLSVNLSL